jgi:hypothetical protein
MDNAKVAKFRTIILIGIGVVCTVVGLIDHNGALVITGGSFIGGEPMVRSASSEPQK